MSDKIKVEILRGFNYSDDGIHGRALVAGGIEEITLDCFEGLKAEGYVRKASSKGSPAPSTAGLKDAGAAPENKAAGNAPENKVEATAPDLLSGTTPGGAGRSASGASGSKP